jgi:hypothetical protein
MGFSLSRFSVHEAVAYHRKGGEVQDILEINRIGETSGQRIVEGPSPAVGYRPSAGLSIEGAGFVSRYIKLHVFLVDPLVAVHAIFFRVVIHSVVPPVEQGIRLGLVHRISIVTSRIFMDHPAGDIIDLAIASERVQHQKEPPLVIVVLVNPCREVWFEWKVLLRPSSRSGKEEKKRDGEDGSQQP